MEIHLPTPILTGSAINPTVHQVMCHPMLVGCYIPGEPAAPANMGVLTGFCREHFSNRWMQPVRDPLNGGGENFFATRLRRIGWQR